MSRPLQASHIISLSHTHTHIVNTPKAYKHRVFREDTLCGCPWCMMVKGNKETSPILSDASIPLFLYLFLLFFLVLWHSFEAGVRASVLSWVRTLRTFFSHDALEQQVHHTHTYTFHSSVYLALSYKYTHIHPLTQTPSVPWRDTTRNDKWHS